MVYFFISLIIVFFFFIFISYLAFKSRSFYLFSCNLIGALAAVMAATLELKGQQTELSLFILATLILLVLLFNFITMIIQFFKDKRKKLNSENIWQEMQMQRDERLIFWEEDFQKDLEFSDDSNMTDRVQALQMWQAGNETFLQNLFDEAAEKYQLSFKWQPTAVALINLSAVHLARNRFEEALQAGRKAVQMNPSRKEAWINQGLAFAGLNRHEEALQSYKKALSEDQNDETLLVLISKTERQLGDLQKSIETIDRALELDPEVRDGWFCKGIAMDLSGKLEQAVTCFEKAQSQQPKNSSIHYHLANALNKLDRNKQAIASYRKAIKLNPVYPEAWNNLGIAQSKTDKLQDSVESYRKAIEMKPDYHEAWLNNALACDSLKRFADAANAYRKFLELAPESLAKHIAIAQKNLELVEKKLAEQSQDNSTGETVAPVEKDDKAAAEKIKESGNEETDNSSAGTENTDN